MITYFGYAAGLACAVIAIRHRLDVWATLRSTRRRLAELEVPRVSTRDVTTTLTDLARSVRSGLTVRSSLLDDAQRPGSIFPTSVVGRLTRGDVIREICRDDFDEVDPRLRRAIELADLAGLHAPDILDVAADSIRLENELGLLAHVAGSHSRSTMAVLTTCSVLAILVSGLVSSSVRDFVASPAGVWLGAMGVGCNLAGRLWIAREISRATRGDESSSVARDVILTLESLVLAGYSLQGALMTAHTWLQEKSTSFTEIAERLHAGHTLESTLTNVEWACDAQLRGIIHGIRIAHQDGGPIHTFLATMRHEITRREEHRLAATIQRTPVRLILPLVTCALPSFLIIGVIPVLVAITGGLTTTNGV